MMIRIVIDGKKRDITPERAEELLAAAVAVVKASRKVDEGPTKMYNQGLMNDAIGEMDFVAVSAGLVSVE